MWAQVLGETRTCSSPPQSFQGGDVTCWEVKFPSVPVFPGKARVISIFPELEPFPEPGSVAQPVVELELSGALQTRLPHGSAGAVEAAGVLRAACQPGDAGREDPGRGY